jgi:hypothetical protein
MHSPMRYTYFNSRQQYVQRVVPLSATAREEEEEKRSFPYAFLVLLSEHIFPFTKCKNEYILCAQPEINALMSITKY